MFYKHYAYLGGNFMKKVIYTSMLCAGLLFTFTGCDKKENKPVASNQCDGVPQLMATIGDKNVYSYCVTDFSFDMNGSKVDLRDYIKNTDNAIDNIIGTLKVKNTLDDGGTTIYEGKNITLVKCNTLSGDKDVYIEASGLYETFCK